MKRLTNLLAAATLAGAASLAFAQDIKIAHIYGKTGPFEAYAKQTQTGLMMGIEYATNGSMTVLGRKIVVIEKDDQLKPDLAKSLLAQAYGDDKVDLAIGPTGSGSALAMLPVAEEYKKILLVEPAVADSITGAAWNRYVFRTGRNSSQDAIAAAVATPQNAQIAMLAQDYAFGRDGVKALKDALAAVKSRAVIVHEEYVPQATTDFTAPEHRKRFAGAQPDFFTAGGMAAGIALVEAIKKAGGTDTEKLIVAMEGMSFMSPKGQMTFRKEDHQALQDMYQFRIKKVQANEWDLLDLVREIPAREIPLPIRNKR